ncbi:hypothetical protein BDW69DRAFT_199213 [Aspergillus filifer]
MSRSIQDVNSHEEPCSDCDLVSKFAKKTTLKHNDSQTSKNHNTAHRLDTRAQLDNRTISAGEPLNELGATPAASLIDLVEKCDVIFTMIIIDKNIFVDCLTVHPDTTARVSATLSDLGATFLWAPVFGGPAIAASGQLVVAIGAPRSGLDVVRRYFERVMGRKVIDCAVGEAQVFAEKTGLGTAAMEELIGESFGGVAEGYSKRSTTGIYAPPLDPRPGFGICLAIKDAEHALSLAKDVNAKLPGTETAHRNMRAARDYAAECLDSSSMYGVLRMDAGMPFWNKVSWQG